MNNSLLNRTLPLDVVKWILFPSLWIKIIFSFGANEEFDKNIFYQFFSIADISILVSIIIWWLLIPPSKLSKVVIYIVAILFTLNILTWSYIGVEFLSQIRFFLKLVIPVLFFMVLLEFTKIYPRHIVRYINITVFILIFCTIYAFIFFDVEFNRSIEWMPVYFSSLHTTSYVWVGIFFILFGSLDNIHVKNLIWVMIFLLIGTAWGVRTAQGALIVFAILYIFFLVKNHNIRNALLTIIIAPLLYVVSYIFVSPDFMNDLDIWTSGRLSMYVAKVEQIIDSGLLNILFGNGAGADLIVTDIWWWRKLGAHNDYLTMVVEQGLAFMIVTILLFVVLMKSLKDNYISMIIFIYMFTSIVSNGFMVRPVAAYILFLSICVYMAHQVRNSGLNDNRKSNSSFTQ